MRKRERKAKASPVVAGQTRLRKRYSLGKPYYFNKTILSTTRRERKVHFFFVLSTGAI